MIFESVEQLVPHGLEALDKHGFRERNPYVINDEVSASEIFQLEIGRLLNTVFEMVREPGWRSVSPRSIARRLGSSTMPISSSLKSMADIEREMRVRADEPVCEYQAVVGRTAGCLGKDVTC